MPINSKAIIYDADATICLRMVKLVTLILEHSYFAQHGKAVSKTSRHKELETDVRWKRADGRCNLFT